MEASLTTQTIGNYPDGSVKHIIIALKLGVLKVNLTMDQPTAIRLARSLLDTPNCDYRINNTGQYVVTADLFAPLLSRDRFGDHKEYIHVTGRSFTDPEVP